MLAALEHLEGAPGRLQRIGAGPKGGEAYVDYAHTPDGLETVLGALRPHATGRLIVVFGAGGDRDRGKRPMMGEIAAQPRRRRHRHRRQSALRGSGRDPRRDPAPARRACARSATGARRSRAAAACCGDGDVLVVAGKGHEQGQIVGATVHPFDDVDEIAARAWRREMAAHD